MSEPTFRERLCEALNEDSHINELRNEIKRLEKHIENIYKFLGLKVKL